MLCLKQKPLDGENAKVPCAGELAAAPKGALRCRRCSQRYCKSCRGQLNKTPAADGKLYEACPADCGGAARKDLARRAT